MSKMQMNEMGNPLEKISLVIDFKFFRELLESKLLNTDKKNRVMKLDTVLKKCVK